MPRRLSRREKKLVLLDAHAIIHRAYHALPDFTSPSGEPSGALYGLSSMLLRIISDLEPDYLAACYDLPKPTVRHEAYEDYKATRTKTDDALIAQLKSSRRIFQAFCIPIYEREGFEADDILGTIAELLRADAETEVIIASGDMDTLQLVEEDRVRVYTLKKGLNDTILYDADAVQERFGFTPLLIPDWKGLRGDPSDNIKGVPGIGEKTATDLIQNFGTIEDLYKTLKADENALIEKGIKPRIIGLLKEHEEAAVFSKMLATIRRDAPIAFRLSDTAWRENPNLGSILPLFDELGFRSLRPRAQALLGHTDDLEEEKTGEEAETVEVPEQQFREAQVMLWLLHSDFTNPSLEDILAYANVKDLATAHTFLEEKLKKEEKVYDVWNTIEKPLVPVIMGMEQHGVLIDTKALATLKKEYSAELSKIEQRIYKAAGKEFNISSPKQLGTILFDELGLGAKGQKRTATGQRSTRESELEKLRELHPIIDDILEYREVQKLLSTYVEAIAPLLDTKGRLHASFIQTGTTTGRMASANPNLQNIPIRTERGRRVRGAFVAPKGFSLVALDYSQIELRIAALLSKDEKLCEIFRSGRDVHQEVAARVFGVDPSQVDAEMRRRAKVINFGILYGMGVNALKAQLGTTIGEAHRFLDDYFNTFTTLSQFLESTKGYARKHGYTETLFGRRRLFPEMKSPLPYVRAQAERMAINAPIQGTQSDIIKLAMVKIDQMLEETGCREDAHLLLQVHDELVYEVRDTKLPELAKKIEDIMESILTPDEACGVPIIAEARSGPSWDDMRKLA
ncbi:MAG TPA: DNA polymerase [Candidatus Paceibacterota bacterium]|nr:DNA polymerase [Candidatus Paceibacterota bacterium]